MSRTTVSEYEESREVRDAFVVAKRNSPCPVGKHNSDPGVLKAHSMVEFERDIKSLTVQHICLMTIEADGVLMVALTTNHFIFFSPPLISFTKNSYSSPLEINVCFRESQDLGPVFLGPVFCF